MRAALMLANAVIWVITVLLTGWPGMIQTVQQGPTVQQLVDFGGSGKTLLFGFHEYWRTISASFLHIGAMHLVFNTIGLMFYGIDPEKHYGKARFLLLYLVSGAGGMLLSARMGVDSVGAGASASIFGLIGLILSLLLRHRAPRQHLQQMFWMAGILFLAGFMPGHRVDNWGHAGGLMSGFLLGFLISPRPASPTLKSRLLDAACAIASAALLIYGLGGAALNTWTHLFHPETIPLITVAGKAGYTFQIPRTWQRYRENSKWEVWRSSEMSYLYVKRFDETIEGRISSPTDAAQYTREMIESTFRRAKWKDATVLSLKESKTKKSPEYEIRMSVRLPKSREFEFRTDWIESGKRQYVIGWLTPAHQIGAEPLFERIVSTFQAERLPLKSR